MTAPTLPQVRGTLPFGGNIISGLGAPTADNDAVRRVYVTDNFQPLDAELTALAGLTSVADALPYFTGSGTAAVTTLSAYARTFLDDADEATLKATLNLESGVDVQTYNANLSAIAALAVTDGNIIVGNGSAWVAESGATARTSLGVGTGNSPQFTGLEIGHATDTTITRTGAGDIAVEGNVIYRAGGTDVPVTDGGTGASTASDARDNLGLTINTDVQAYNTELAAIAGLATTDGGIIVGNGSTFVLETGATARTSLGVGTGDSPTFTGVTTTGNAAVGGSLTVTGTLVHNGPSVWVDAENVSIAANYTRLNRGYTTDAAQSGGIVVNYDPTTTQTTTTGAGIFTAGVDGVSNPTVTTQGSGTFSAGDLVQISGSNSNDGLYEVASHSGTTLTIRSTDSGTTDRIEAFTNDAFTAGTDTGATLTKIAVSVARCGTDGNWEVGSGSTTGITFYDLVTTSTLSVAINDLTDVDVDSPTTGQILIYDGADSFDNANGDTIAITATGVNYSEGSATLAGHLSGIDTAINSKASTSHATDHEDGGTDAITGGSLELSTSVSNFTPAGTTLGEYMEAIDGALSTAGAPYSSTFDATTSWGAASGGIYTITITAGTHGKGTSPKEVTIYEDDGTNWIPAPGVIAKINKTTGDISFEVSETPDDRFAGRIVIS